MTNIQLIVGKIFKDQDSMSLDAASLLMYYIQALGSASDIFIATWLEKILKREKSLFTLSAYLFSKKGKLFFDLWSKIENDYAAIFWVAFWSEQVWRAYNFVYLTQQKQYAEAKKISMRLPFTFMQRDYKQFSLQELKQAHDQIYAIDFSLKNGGSQEQLDLFFSKFISR